MPLGDDDPDSGAEAPGAGPGADLGRVEIATEQDEGYPHVGELDYIDNTVNPATGTIQLRALIPNDDFTLFPGLFVRIRVAAGVQADAILVREIGIGRDLGGNFVLVVADDGLVERRYVTVGALQDDGYVVVEEGLEGTERYITNGLLRARPGLPVTPQSPEEAEGGPVAGRSAPQGGAVEGSPGAGRSDDDRSGSGPGA